MKYYKISEELLEHILSRCSDAIEIYDEMIEDPERGLFYAAGYYKGTVETVRTLLDSTMKYAEVIE